MDADRKTRAEPVERRPFDEPAAAPGDASGTSTATAQNQQHADDAAENSATDAWRRVPVHIRELWSYAQFYLAARADAARFAAKRVAIYATLGVLALILGAGVIVTAVALLLVGIAHAIGALLGGRLWAGDLIVSVLVLTALGVGTRAVLAKLRAASRRATEKKYDAKRSQQRAQFGHDVRERARAAEDNRG